MHSCVQRSKGSNFSTTFSPSLHKISPASPLVSAVPVRRRKGGEEGGRGGGREGRKEGGEEGGWEGRREGGREEGGRGIRLWISYIDVHSAVITFRYDMHMYRYNVMCTLLVHIVSLPSSFPVPSHDVSNSSGGGGETFWPKYSMPLHQPGRGLWGDRSV